MKKALSLLMALVTCLGLCACSKGDDTSDTAKQSISLSPENINNFLHIDANVTDCNISNKSGSVLDFYYKIYEGNAEIEIDVVNQSEAIFENVTIVCDIYTYVDCDTTNARYGWEFDYGNTNSGLTPHSDKNSKRITIVLPSNGNWSDTEALNFVAYDDQCNFVSGPYKLSVCGLKIISVTGTVKK